LCFLAHLSQSLNWAFVIEMCLVSVHPYVVNLSHFQFLFQNHCMQSHQTYHKCSFMGSDEVCYLFEAIIDLRWLPGLRFFPQNYCMWSDQTCQKCFSGVPQKVLSLQSNFISSMAIPASYWLWHFKNSPPPSVFI